MRRAGTHVIASCDKPGCGHYWTVDLGQMISEIGSQEATLWDRHGPCERPGCDGTVSYLASPGPGTPKRPLISMHAAGGLPIEAWMDRWVGLDATPCINPLAAIGVGWRDWIRIRDMVLSTHRLYHPAALNDLSIPYRVGACPAGEESRSTGEAFARYAGRTILVWEKPRDWRRPRR